MLILPPDAEDPAVGAVVDRIGKIVSDEGGETGKVDKWGRRRLAFEIAHHNEGFYVVVEFTADPKVVAELDRTLQLADEVLRFKIVVRAAA